jgi:hypothetical protein
MVATGTLTYDIAYRIMSLRMGFETFFKQAKHNEWYSFTHQNFFYSGPEFGKQWANGQHSQFHRIQTMCNCCGKLPERNYAGYGTLYAYKSHAALPKQRIVLFCRSCRDWRDSKEFNALPIIRTTSTPKPELQLQLF